MLSVTKGGPDKGLRVRWRFRMEGSAVTLPAHGFVRWGT